jgi:BCD family chlorophyll transporter-like MFS transporter
MVSHLGWLGIFRVGLVQAALGAIVVLTTSTLNRVMVVELALPAMVPGALVALHHAMQMLRPRMGHGSDLGQRRTPWIVGGMAVLALGGTGAALATALMGTQMAAGLALAAVSFVLIGAGVSAAGTSLLVLLAKRVAPERQAAAATLVWMMMIMGFAVTAGLTGRWLDPYSAERLVTVVLGVSAVALVVAVVSIWGVEGHAQASAAEAPSASRRDFMAALKEVWAEPNARQFTVFVLVSMLSYSAQDLVLEPFAGSHFGFTPGETTKLSGVQHGGVFAGMLLVAVVTTVFKGRPAASLKAWVAGGCAASALAMAGLVLAGLGGTGWPLRENVMLLGMANGAFSIAAIGSMMALAGQGGGSREGIRMGIWGAAQAIAFGCGGFVGTVLADAARWLTGSSSAAYAFVFALETAGFLAAALISLGIRFPTDRTQPGLGVSAQAVSA